jgi:uncharacterized membrane protein YuzA (DUF378 family)
MGTCSRITVAISFALLVLFLVAVVRGDYVREKVIYVILGIFGIVVFTLLCALIPSNHQRMRTHYKQEMKRGISLSTIATLRCDLCMLCLSVIEDYERDVVLFCCGRRLHEDCVLMAVSFGNQSDATLRCPECRRTTTACLPI